MTGTEDRRARRKRPEEPADRQIIVQQPGCTDCRAGMQEHRNSPPRFLVATVVGNLYCNLEIVCRFASKHAMTRRRGRHLLRHWQQLGDISADSMQVSRLRQSGIFPGQVSFELRANAHLIPQARIKDGSGPHKCTRRFATSTWLAASAAASGKLNYSFGNRPNAAGRSVHWYDATASWLTGSEQCPGSRTIDVHIKRFWEHGHLMYGLSPYTVTEGRAAFDSTIKGRQKAVKRPKLKLMRPVTKLSWFLKRVTFNLTIANHLPRCEREALPTDRAEPH